ncbi:MAG TPA: hypothetical protein DD670_08320 [Planctomycetaceae bacterium]|nr:hypothetical protein [Planctomycetaceae bacterium]
MHVTFLIRDHDILYGAERATVDLASGLVHSGVVDISATVICDIMRTARPSGLERAMRNCGISCHLIPARRGFSPRLISVIRNHIRSAAIDCVHAIGYQASVHGGFAARFGQLCPWVATVHGWLERPELKERFYSWVDLQMLKRAQRVVVLSTFYRNKLEKCGVRKERITWIPSGLNLSDLHVEPDVKTVDSRGGIATIGILGRLSSEKNHVMFLSVARRLLDDGARVQFLVAGDGPERRHIESLVQRLGLQSAVEIAGVVGRDEFFRRIDVLALCSRIENLPYVILEAMAWSRPVVTTRVGGVPDLIESGENGLLVDDGDVDGMVEAIGRLLEDTLRAQAMGRNGRRRLEDRFTLERSVASHLAMYQEVVGGRHDLGDDSK